MNTMKATCSHCNSPLWKTEENDVVQAKEDVMDALEIGEDLAASQLRYQRALDRFETALFWNAYGIVAWGDAPVIVDLITRA